MPKGGHHCCVVGCNSNSSYSIPKRRFFRIPAAKTKAELRHKWIRLIKRAPPFAVTGNTRVCDLHFVDKEPTLLNPLPVINMGYTIDIKKPRREVIRKDVPVTAKKRKVVKQPLVENVTGEGTSIQDPTDVNNSTGIHMHSDVIQDVSVVPAPVSHVSPTDHSEVNPEYTPIKETLSVTVGQIDHTGELSLENERHQTEENQQKEAIQVHDHTYIAGDISIQEESANQDLSCDDTNSPLHSSNAQFDSNNVMPPGIPKSNGTLPAIIKKMARDISMLKNQVRNLQLANKTRPKFSINDISHSDKKVHFYTGLPSYKAFHVIFEKLVKKSASKLAMNTRFWKTKSPWYKRGRKTGGQRKLTLENEFLLVLMKIRLGSLDEDLADRFGVSPASVSLLVNRWLPVLSRCLKKLIVWPSRDLIRTHLPAQFKKKLYANTRVIIDCAEIFIERPSNILARQQTYSNYKHHNTAKFLVGITPTGGICTLSKAWGGRASDKHIVENSKPEFLDKLDVGDQVMADRGFDISNILARKSCTLVIPPFTRGKTQLSQREVEQGRQIATLRIHVERAIERIKRFRILQGVFPIKRLCLLNDILTVSAALTNLQPPLVVDPPKPVGVEELSGLAVVDN
ncbi:uncharacterized protein LOC144438467 [Glandiceps talaboti]